MRDRLTDEQIERYRTNGFLVIEQCLDTDELEEWRRCTDEAVAQRLGGSIHFLTNQMDPDNFYAQVFTQCLRLADTHEGMHKLIFDPRLGRMGATLTGIDGIRVWHDQALIKPPHGNPTAWHLDDPYWSFDSPNAISVWVALDDATLANGCLWYLPGTHKTARYENVGIGPNLGDLFKVYPDWRTLEPVPCPCPAGSIVWHNGLTAHAAGANMTTKSRRAMTCAFMPDGATFNGKKNVLPDDYFASLKVGDVLKNEQQNPLVWHTSWEQRGGR
ncbi:MAG: phytanoyl-CoA dioxygenase family protein [Candidatus Latescibacteria bacterium]|nr:phytanoyl-CoA dioxygenase family protein [Candidatus Latescibacterota bacterium]